MDKENGLIHSIETTSANVHDLSPDAELPHGQGAVVYADDGYQGIEKRREMKGKTVGFLVAMRPGKRRALSDTPPESLRVVEIPWGLSPGYAGAELTTAQGSGA